MAPLPQLPDAECPNCAEEGNRFMQHVETRTRKLPTLGPEEDCDHIAIFRCVKCRHAKSEAFDPKAL
jgi:Zn ribbon nucleic-acid-binding protein